MRRLWSAVRPILREMEPSSTGAPRPSLRRASTEPIAPSSDFRHQPAAANNAAAPAHPPGGGAPATANARVARPPLNPYLRIAIIRGDDDLVTFDDVENPGAKRSVPVGQLVDEDRDRKRRRRAEEKKKETEGESKSDTAAGSESSPPSLKDDADGNGAAKSKNKKEIAVPSITEVKRYETDVPDNYPVPPSYVRYRFPTYDDVHGGTVDYTADRDDEAWLAADGDFGTNSRARVAWGPSEDGKNGPTKEEADGGGAGDGGNEARPADKQQQSAANASKATKKPRMGKKLPTKKSKKQQPAAVKSEGGGERDAAPASDAVFNFEEGEPAGEGTTPTIHEVILSNPVYLHSRLTTRQLVAKYRPRLPLPVLEQMIDRLEKATGFGFVVGKDAARKLLAESVPDLEGIFGPLDDDERRLVEEEEEAHVRRVLAMRIRPRAGPGGDGGDGPGGKAGSVPRLVPPIVLARVIDRVYDYWVEKRTRLRRPLLRRYKPPVAASDTNPHVVFRQRDVTSRRRLRKKRSDDVESYRKLRQLKADFESVRTLCRLVRAREDVARFVAECSDEYFEARLHERTDTSGLPRKRPDGRLPLTAERVEAVLSSVPRVYDDGPILRTRGNKKRRRGGHQSSVMAGMGGLSSSIHSISDAELGFSSRGPSPVPPGAAGGNKRGRKGNSSAAASKAREPSPAARRNKVVVAGHDGGYPAPNFLQPLATRGNPFGNMSRHGDCGPSAPASIPSYVDGKRYEDPESYTHRPRLGRGGRIIVDRVPRPSAAFSSEGQSPAVVTYGAPMARSGYDLSDLGVDNPGYAAGAAAGSPGNKTGGSAGGRSTRFGSAGVTGCDARTAPKASHAASLSDLVQKFDDPEEVSRRIELICARGLVSDCQDSAAAAAAQAAGTTTSKGRGGAGDAASSAAIAGRGSEEVLVPLDDWSEAPEGTYGRERFVVGLI